MTDPTPNHRAPVIDPPVSLANGRFSCRFRYVDHTGERKSVTVRGHTAHEARHNAERACAEAVQRAEALRRGEHTGPSPTFAEVAAEALPTTIAARQKPKQRHHTRMYLERWWYPHVGDKPIDRITAADCNAVVAAARGVVKDATCNRILCAGAVVFRHAEASDLIDRIPTARATRLREGRKIPIIYSAPELLAVIEALDAAWLPFVGLMALAGLRKTEAMEIRRGDVDLDNGQIIVRCGDAGTKSGHDRLVPILSSALHTALETALERTPGRRARLVEQNDPRKAMNRAARAAGVDKVVSPHRLRHGFASLVHAGGVKQRGASVRAVQAWLGHSTLSVTERYTHLARPTPEADLLFDRLHHVVGKWGM
ncbi:MAG: tyrosine-type recombinase/integrase [Myxococcales bacterium]|nr:tyrosine-type recombinase/integrase [Myxococcales bacterium]